MNKQEINEFLAERLFGLKNTGNGWYKQHEYNDWDCPDYISHYQRVLEKLLLNKMIIDITFESAGTMIEITVRYHFGRINLVASSMGEAICRAAVEYLKAQEVRDE